MKTRIKREEDTVVVSVDGMVDYETQDNFKENLSKVINSVKKSVMASTDSAPRKIIVNMENLQFVGSSGISTFVQTLKDFNDRLGSPAKYCNVRSEFQKVIQAYDDHKAFEFFESEDQAKDSFDQ